VAGCSRSTSAEHVLAAATLLSLAPAARASAVNSWACALARLRSRFENIRSSNSRQTKIKIKITRQGHAIRNSGNTTGGAGSLAS
jgi:hypothetical protein